MIALLGSITLIAAVVRLTERLAVSPWEPAIAMEAARLNAGLPLYEAGHATHMYGPLLTVLLAEIFRVTGLNLLAGRIGFSIFAFALAFLLSAILCRGSSRKYWFVAFALFLGVNLRTNLIFLSAQPDCIAALFAVGGLCLWAERRDSLLRSVCAIGLFVCAVLFKQTSAAFALIPIVYVLIWKRGLQNLFASLIPATSILVTLGIIRFIWPQVFHAMITVPGSIEVNYGHVPLISGYLIATFLVQVDRDLALLFLRCGDEKYETAVDFARRTPDRVISPQDPTIAYRGAGYFGRSLFFELDAHAVNGNWPSELPNQCNEKWRKRSMSCKS